MFNRKIGFKMKKFLIFGLISLAALIVAAFFGDVLNVAQVGLLTLCEIPLLVTGSNSHVALKDAREERARIAKQMTDLNDISVKEKRSLTAEEEQKWNKLEKDLSVKEAEVRRLETSIDLESRFASIDDLKPKGVSKDENIERRAVAFREWLQSGLSGMKPESQAVLMEMRALSAGTAADGGYTIPEGFMNKIEQAMLAFGGIYAVGNRFTTSTGNDIPYPTVNDTGNSGEILGENTSVGSSVDPTFGVVTLKAYKYSSKPVLVSNVLLQDSAFNLESILANMLAERIARILATHLATGNGTTQPHGIVTAATNASLSGVAAAAITFDNLIDLFHSVDPNYRVNGTWLFNDNTLKVLRKVKDSDGRPIWQGNYDSGAPATILGRPYQVVKEIADIGASAKSILFGDMNKYMIREVSGGEVKRLVERYADADQTAFLLFQRKDARLIDAGTHPVKYLVHAAS